MNKIKSFLFGILLLTMSFGIVVLTALIYRANERSSIKSYIFQVNDIAADRIGALQDIDKISAIDLRNKLIYKYVSEYFKVIPGETNANKHSILRQLSSTHAYNQWLKGEGTNIEKMAAKKMFRIVYVPNDGIVSINKPDNYDYYSTKNAPEIYYMVRYETLTWSESNLMKIDPKIDHGVVYLRARFKPGIDPTKNVRSDLEKDNDPIGLFMFEVVSVDDKE